MRNYVLVETYNRASCVTSHKTLEKAQEEMKNVYNKVISELDFDVVSEIDEQSAWINSNDNDYQVDLSIHEIMML